MINSWGENRLTIPEMKISEETKKLLVFMAWLCDQRNSFTDTFPYGAEGAD